MSPLRSMMRLDVKVAAETRRLAALGGTAPKGAVLVALASAVAVHATLLALPLPARFAPFAASAARPDLPYVWRWGPPAPASEPPSAASVHPTAHPHRALVPSAAAPEDDEPVPEPAPSVAATTIPAEMEALIPPPDGPAPAAGADRVPKDGEASPAMTELVPVVKVRPAYPAAARSVRASGSVELALRVREDGTIEDARAVSCTRTGVGFEDAALAAVRRFRYVAAPPGSGPRAVRVHVAFGAAGAGP